MTVGHDPARPGGENGERQHQATRRHEVDGARVSVEAEAPGAVGRTMGSGTATFTMPELEERGWTATMIWRLLGDPDATVGNPGDGSEACVGLWRVERVHAAQTTETWARAVDAAHEYSLRGLRCSKRRRERALQVLDDTPVSLPDLDRDTLIREACEYHSRWSGAFAGESGPASSGMDPAFLNRICVDYLLLRTVSPEQIFGQLADEGIKIDHCEVRWHRRVLETINQQYPYLAADLF
jgi:hypothetical protein